MSGLRHAGRKPVKVSQDEVIKREYLTPGRAIPYVIRPGIDRADLVDWARVNRQLIDDLLLEHRALLFRGFDVRAASEFMRFAEASSDGPLLEYNDRSTPRYEVDHRIYVSTIYPADQSIILHNEGTYWLRWPLKIYFCCLKAPGRGGQTPIADVRNVYQRISHATRARFTQKKVMYLRNYNDGFGLSWQEAFQTSDPAKGEEYCRQNKIDFEWKTGGRLRTRQIREAVRKHPRTGEFVWFNHAAFFHILAREPEVRKGLLDLFDEIDLPYMTYYGDGTPIDSSVIEEILDAYNREKVLFDWQEGDILLLDNMSVAHGREPYVGERQIVVAMTEAYGEGA
jgi:alpha-ketoglutarate-dependent taurine dioxygenase